MFVVIMEQVVFPFQMSGIYKKAEIPTFGIDALLELVLSMPLQLAQEKLIEKFVDIWGHSKIPVLAVLFNVILSP